MRSVKSFVSVSYSVLRGRTSILMNLPFSFAKNIPSKVDIFRKQNSHQSIFKAGAKLKTFLSNNEFKDVKVFGFRRLVHSYKSVPEAFQWVAPRCTG